MIGDLIARIRSDKNVSKTDLSKATNHIHTLLKII